MLVYSSSCCTHESYFGTRVQEV